MHMIVYSFIDTVVLLGAFLLFTLLQGNYAFYLGNL